ncbi:carboxylesterase/lipase family protein [Corallococcus macrosporus]|uniref:Carboxylic ester hydrolase n=1 Tax=Corallococcus macrosporus DSM 14697 TaxID=1189310 RepID=A0A250JQN9_9BACT|nr:carboxylesterase family protein [Corallococcus macrosporus]ATB46184.1 carboxylesterase [Corallococcus macrosporus DSM 14697]
MSVIKTPEVSTREGKVQGLVEGAISVFRGIPYAKPPTGALRWRAPERVNPWPGVREAYEFGYSALQSRQACIEGGGGDPGEMREDCLYLNVWTPRVDAGAKLPVVFWIHGGAFVIGSGRVPPYDGFHLAARDVVLVTFNYRLGHLGFFVHPALEKEHPGGPANFGLLDQMLALEWVRDNIAQFGGDPSNVTVMGQSAGAKSVLSLFTSPLVREKNLFRQGVAMSAYVLQEKSLSDAKLAGMAFAWRNGLDRLLATAEELRALSPEKFWMLPTDTVNAPSPIYGDSVLPEPIRESFERGSQLPLPLILGSTSDDSSVVSSFGIDPGTILERLGAFAPAIRQLYPDVDDDREIGRRMCRDFVFTVLPRMLASRHAASGAAAWRYYFDYNARLLVPRQRLGVPHGGEVPYFLETAADVPPSGEFFTDEDRTFLHQLVASLVQFARTGTPGPVAQVTWEGHTETQDRLLRLEVSPRMEADFERTILQAAESLIPILDSFARPPPPKLPRAASPSTSASGNARPELRP